MSSKSTNWQPPKNSIAIIGMAGRFPASRNIEQFWLNLREGRDCIARLTAEELIGNGVDQTLLNNENFVAAGGVLDDIELFDAQFFRISPREADSMDPQQRIFLETVQHALDDAGCDPERVTGPVGVYAGCRLSGYWLRLLNNNEFMRTTGWQQVAAGNDKDFLATQASFRFNLRGPSVNVQAACSTSLLATSLACDALNLRQCDVAIAGGASVAVPHKTGYLFQTSGIASPDGYCRPFDAGANGSVLGNGVAAVVLKRLPDAVADGDRIYAVIRSTAVNNDGSSKSSFAAPSVQGQADVIAEALRRAGLKPHEIDYIEAHGTATSLGDPMEIAALTRVFGNDPQREELCGIGSVKGNVGHLDPAAGITSLIKVALSLHHGELPPSIHFERPNPAIDFVAAGLRVVSSRTSFPSRSKPRHCGVSSFGIGGTNVHAVLEQSPAQDERVSEYPSHLFPISARSAEALSAMQSELADHLLANPDLPLENVAFTLACGRRQFSHRRSIVASSHQQAIAALGQTDKNAQHLFAADREVFFLFPGQGTQRLCMGRELYCHEPVFRKAVDAVAEFAAPHLGFDLRMLLAEDPAINGKAPDVEQTEVAQPFLFAVDYATAQLWLDWGIRPDGMLGHSIGELVAACIANVMSLVDAVKIVCRRGQLMQKMVTGSMLAVQLTPEEAVSFENEEIRVAAFNAPKQQTLSGSNEAIASLAERLKSRKIAFQRLKTSHAFHHPSMQPAADELLEVIQHVQLNPPMMPFVSNLTGGWVSSEQATSPNYWSATIVSPVNFSAGAGKLLERSKPVFIECGPGRALAPLIASHNGHGEAVVVSSLAHNGESDLASIKTALGKVWQAGVAINWNNVWRDRLKKRVSLPAYPFQRKRHWIDGPPMGSMAVHPPAASRNFFENIYCPSWQPSTVPASRESQGGLWLVLVDETGFGMALCDRIAAAGERVVAVLPGQEYQSVSDRVYRVDPKSLDDAEHLIADLRTTDGSVHIVNCWTTLAPGRSVDIERGDLGVERGFLGPTLLLQALTRSGRAIASVYSITTKLFRIAAEEVPDPTFAPALGIARVLPQEMPGVRAGVIDIDLPATPLDARSKLEQVAAELFSEATEPVVAYRCGMRLVQSFDRVALPPPAAGRSRLRSGGTYLITGGFGGIGGVLASQLASFGNTRIVLVSRRGLESSETVGQDSSSQKLVQALEAGGASVLTLTADISDAAQTRRVVETIRTRFGEINGVIHTAGIAGGGLLVSRNPVDALAVFAAKVRGSIALIGAVELHRPDFFVLCSSFAAVTGGVGQADYCGANAFQDAVASYGRAVGLPITSINWPAWRDVGMAASMTPPHGLEAIWQASLAAGITPAEGAELFTSVLGADFTQIIIPPLASASGANDAEATAHMPVLARSTDVPTINSKPPKLSATAPVGDDLGATLQHKLGNVWSEALGMDQVDPNANFFEIGGHSLIALQIVSRVREQFPVELDLTDIFDNPTLPAFAELVHSRLIAAVSAMSDEKVSEALSARRAL